MTRIRRMIADKTRLLCAYDYFFLRGSFAPFLLFRSAA